MVYIWFHLIKKISGSKHDYLNLKIDTVPKMVSAMYSLPKINKDNTLYISRKNINSYLTRNYIFFQIM